ncbi:MAG: hypothetical protein HQM10_04220 [Candidatus Riflebacteria bacterium]|nr:hypothetical protein [Candidatus Riflebacteria bacterium]
MALKKANNWHKIRTGLSLIEIMIAVFILAAAILPIFDVMMKSLRISKNSREEVIAANLASELIDQISCMPYESLSPVLPIADHELPDDENGRSLNQALLIEAKLGTMLILSNLPPGFRRFLSVEKVTPNLRKVSVKVLFGKGADSKSLSFFSLIEKRQ